jgi:hypothetical protein
VIYVFESVDGTHSWLAGHASRNYDDMSTLEDLGKTVIWRKVAFNLSGCCDVGEVGGDTRCIDDIIEAELVDCSHSACVGWGEPVTSVTRGFVLSRRAKG